jgi:hypothetical protein
MAEEGMSLTFDALGLDKIQQKIATTAKSFKSLDREAKKLSGLGRGLGRLASLGGGAAKGGIGPFADIAAQLGSFGIATRLASRSFRIFESLGAERLVSKRAVKAVAAKGRRIIRSIGRVSKVIAIPELRMLGRELLKGYSILGKKLLKGVNKVTSRGFLTEAITKITGRKIATNIVDKIPSKDKIISIAKTGIKKVSSVIGGIGIGVIAKKGMSKISSAGMAIGTLVSRIGISIAGFVTGLSSAVLAVSLSAAAIGAIVLGAYFKLDKKIESAMKWFNNSVLKPIGKNLSMVGTFWMDTLGRFTERGDLISSAVNVQQANLRYTPVERQMYEEQVKQDLIGQDKEERIQEDIDLLKQMWKELDDKISLDSKRIVDTMYYQERI